MTHPWLCTAYTEPVGTSYPFLVLNAPGPGGRSGLCGQRLRWPQSPHPHSGSPCILPVHHPRCPLLPSRAALSCSQRSHFFFLIYLFMALLGLRFCARTFSSCGKQGPLFIAVRGPLTIAASLVAEHRLQTRRLSSCGSRA